MTFDAAGNEYIAMGSNAGGNTGGSRYVTPAGAVSTLPTSVVPLGIAVSSTGVVYESNGSTTVYKRTAYTQTATSFSTGFTVSCGLAVDASDNLYVADKTAGTISKLTPAGVKTSYATGLTSPCGIVMNKATGVLYVYATGGIYEVPSGGGTPTLLTSATCTANTGLAIDDVGYLYARGCGAMINQFSPSGTKTNYLVSAPAGANTTAGQNSPTDIGWFGGKVYVGGYSINGMDRWSFLPSGFSASIVWTATDPGVHPAGASLAPTNSGTYSPSSGSASVTVVPSTPSAPDLAASSDLGSSSTDNVTSDTTPTITVPGSYTNGTVMTITAAKSGSTNVTCTYTLPATSCDLGTLAAGVWSLTSTQTVNGAVSAASSALSITIDTTAPTAPTGIDLATASDTGSSSTDNITKINTPTMSATGATPAAGEVVTLTATRTGASPVSCTYTNPATSCVMPTMSDGVWSVSSTLTDVAGNVSAASAATNVTIDTSAPSAFDPDLAAASDTGASSTDDVTSDNTPAITTLPTPEMNVTYVVTATKSPSTATCSFTRSLLTTSCDLTTLADGVWTITIVATDVAGNSTTSTNPLPITIDTTAPSAPLAPDMLASSDTGSSSTDNITSDSTPTITVPSLVIGELYTITATKAPSTVTCSFTATAMVTSCDLGTLADGVWSVTVTDTDPAGNRSASSSPLSITVDTTAPSTPTAVDLLTASDTGTSSTDNRTRTTTPQMGAAGLTGTDTMTITMTIAGSSYSCSYTLPASSCTMPTLPDGTYSATAIITDAAGNVSATSTALTVVITTPPAAPTANDDTAFGEQGSSVTATPAANDTAASLSYPISVSTLRLCPVAAVAPLTNTNCNVTSVTVSGEGTYTLSGGTVTFAPVAGFTDANGPKTSTIRYVIADSYVDDVSSAPIPTRYAAATLTVTLLPPPAPVAVPDTATSTGFRTAVAITPLANDSAGTIPASGYTTTGGTSLDASTLKLCALNETPPTCTATSVAITGQGTYSLSGSTVTFTPLASFHGAAQGVNYAVCNQLTGTWAPTTPSVRCTTSTITATIPAATAPSATADTPTIGFNTATPITVLGNDAKDASVAWSSVALCLPTDTPPLCAQTTLTVAGKGTYVVNNDNTITFTPVTNYVGAVTAVRYIALDEMGQSTWSTITASVSASAVPYDLDLVAASDTGTSSTDNLTGDSTPTFTVSGGVPGDVMRLIATKGGLTVYCEYTLPGTGCTMPVMEDGVWSVVARLNGDPAKQSSPLAVTIDATAPTAPAAPDLNAASDTGPSSTDNATSDTTPRIDVPGGNSGDVITIIATPVGGGTPVSCTFVVGQDTGCTLPTLVDGQWDLSATATDDAGNTSPPTAGPRMTIDTTAPATPAAPDLATASDLGASGTDNLTSDNTPTMSIAGGVDGDTVTMTATPSGGGTPVTCTYVLPASGCDLGTLADGVWDVTASVTDPAGNSSGTSAPLAITIDTTAPSAPGAPDLNAASDTGSSSTDNLTGDNTPHIDLPGGTAGDTITIIATPTGGGTPVSCTFVVGQATGCDLPALADGDWTISATATDPAGNVSPSTAGPTITIDTAGPAGPAAPVLDPASDTGRSNTDGITADTTPTMHVPGVLPGETITLTGTGPNGQVVTCSFVASALIDSCDLGPLADGPWSVIATTDAVDAAGNHAAPSAPSSFTIDTAPPSMPGKPKPSGPTSTDPNGVPQTPDTTPSFSVPGASAPNTVTLDAVGPDGRTASCSYIPSPTVTGCTLGPLVDGLWTITPSQTSPSGIVSPAGPPYTIRIGGLTTPSTPSLLPPDPIRVDVVPAADGNGYTAEAWFAVPVNPKTVIAVVFVIRDRSGKITDRIVRPVTKPTDVVRMRIDTLPKGSKVSAYTINRHGVSPHAPKYSNIRRQDTRRNATRLPNGGFALLGSELGSPVLFDGASADITAAGRVELNRIAKIARRKGGNVYVTGFARRNGIDSDAWLLRLSQRRAENVSHYLADRGVTSWISWSGVGAATSYIGAPTDRRVDIRWAK